MPTRRRVFQVIAAILAVGARAQDTNEAAVAAAARADFVRRQNEFANEFNRLFQDFGQMNVWNVKRARQVARLFDRLTADPSYRV